MKNPLESPLFKAMMNTYERILQSTNDKDGWKWLKTYFVNSLIWYLPHPNYKVKEEKDDQGDDKQSLLKQTLF